MTLKTLNLIFHVIWPFINSAILLNVLLAYLNIYHGIVICYIVTEKGKVYTSIYIISDFLLTTG